MRERSVMSYRTVRAARGSDDVTPSPERELIVIVIMIMKSDRIIAATSEVM